MLKSLTDFFSSLTSRKPSTCCDGGNKRNIGFASPEEAVKMAKEKVIFVTCINTREDKKPDALMAVDVDPESKTYCQVLCKLAMPSPNDELHHSGWNACAGCVHDSSACRTHLLLPSLHSSNLYIIDTANPKDLKIHKTITHKDISHLNVSFLHTTHCMPSGNVMISALGDNEGNNKCDMILIDRKTFEVKKSWPKIPSNATAPKFHYDFWYQPKYNVLLSTEWGTPNNIKKGFNPADVGRGIYGNSVHFWDYTTGKLLQHITFHGDTGHMPLEVRFKHSPDQPHAFVGTALGSAIYHVYKENNLDPWQHELSVAIPAKEVEGWALSKMPGLVTDIIISMDDKYIYVSLWLFGEVRQYNIEDPFNIKLTGTAYIGGLITTESEVKVTHDPEKGDRQPPLRIQHKKIEGGPQMMQLSLDGKRLYVTNSLYSVWDKGFYPDMAKNGGQMVKIDVDTVNGGMQVDPQFLIDFGKIEDGPYCPHEMRYPGGDCTSDIFVPPK